jgi:hypothetical protein
VRGELFFSKNLEKTIWEKIFPLKRRPLRRTVGVSNQKI